MDLFIIEKRDCIIESGGVENNQTRRDKNRFHH